MRVIFVVVVSVLLFSCGGAKPETSEVEHDSIPKIDSLPRTQKFMAVVASEADTNLVMYSSDFKCSYIFYYPDKTGKVDFGCKINLTNKKGTFTINDSLVKKSWANDLKDLDLSKFEMNKPCIYVDQTTHEIVYEFQLIGDNKTILACLGIDIPANKKRLFIK